MATLSDNLNMLRKNRNLTYLDIATGCGIALRTLKYYSAGERKPDSDTLIALADYFGVSIDYLVGRTDKPEVNK